MKQANGEGSVYQRADGRWCTAVTIGKTEAGKPQRRVFYGKSRKEVQQKLREAQDRVKRGGRLDQDKLTVAAFLMRWLDEIVIHRSANTQRQYAYKVRQYLVPALGHLYLVKLQSEDVQRMLNQCSKSGMSPASVQSLRSTLRAAFHQAERWHLVVHNAAREVELPKVTPYEARTLTVEQADQLLAAARGHRMEPLFVLAVHLGMRQGELTGLSWSDIDWERSCVHIRRAVQTHGGKLILGDTKTPASKRTLPLTPALLDILRGHYRRQQERALKRGKRLGSGDLIVASRLGTPIDGALVRRAFKRLLTRAGLPDMRFHDLRHSCASFLGEQGIADRTIMHMLGHTTRGMTDRYTHVQDESKQAAVIALDQLLGRPREAS
jgi:integrase